MPQAAAWGGDSWTQWSFPTAGRSARAGWRPCPGTGMIRAEGGLGDAQRTLEVGAGAGQIPQFPQYPAEVIDAE